MVGTGPTTAVFVHESGPRGLCGFWPYADWLAKTKGVRSVLFSQCGNQAAIRPPVAAVVDLSGERRWQGLDSLTAARRLRVPALFAVAAGTEAWIQGRVRTGTG